MKLTLNEAKKKIYSLVLILNDDKHDIANGTTKFIFFFGIRVTYYTNTKLYSVKEMCDEQDREISNRYILELMIKNLEDLCLKKQQDPKLKMKRRPK